MNRDKKNLVISSLRDDFLKSNAVFLIGVQGLSVGQLQSLRRSLYADGGVLRVAKNTLAKIVVQNIAGFNDLKHHLKQQVALVFATGEAPAIAKIICKSAQDNESVVIIAGCFESNLLDTETIKFLASIPPRPILLAQLCRSLQAPIARSVGLLHHLVARFLWTLQEVSAKKQH